MKKTQTKAEIIMGEIVETVKDRARVSEQPDSWVEDVYGQECILEGIKRILERLDELEAEIKTK